MKKLVVSLALGLGLIVSGASDAKAAAPYCIDFSNFCDCLSVTPVADKVDGLNVRRTEVTWENQDCAGTTSALQGIARDLVQTAAGELNPELGLPGINFNFTIAGGVLDVDSTVFGKVLDEEPFVRVPGLCPSDCSAVFKKPGLPASIQR